ncbi:Trichothecene biosynthesis protein 14 [Cladobotryum mycophilum]|uniref:Trichothecene biosynthesis protein 14 n=1 Tax=Cladobotryum mycophilum TaxID=491253 RepID=A0ABR0S880_9HYPO
MVLTNFDSNLFNATVSTYDVRQKRVIDVITIPGISENPKFHVSGVQVDVARDLLSIVANAGTAFDTAGQDISGDNVLVQYDLHQQRIVWRQNLTAVTKGLYGGFQDVEHDTFGNTFVMGTFPSSIIKISTDGKTATPWFVETNTKTTVHGFSGIATHETGNFLLVADNEKGQILRFDTGAAKGTPELVVLQGGVEPIGKDLDCAYLPPLFRGTVLLVVDNALGVIVIRSKDGKWEKAEKLGAIANAYLNDGGLSTAVVELGGRIYVSTEFFGDTAPAHSLNRTQFPLYDITDEVKKLLWA